MRCHPGERSKVMIHYDRFCCGEETEQYIETIFIYRDGYRVEVVLKICCIENENGNLSLSFMISTMLFQKPYET